MRRITLIPFLLLITSSLFAQAPSCHYNYQLTAVGPTVAVNNDNSGCNAQAWAYTYIVQGFTNISLQLEAANSLTTGAPPGTSFVSFPGQVTTGVQPSTNTPGALVAAVGYFQYVRLNLLSATGTGTVTVYLNGYSNVPTAVTASSAQSGGTVSSNAISVNGASIPANSGCLGSNGQGQFVPCTTTVTLPAGTSLIKTSPSGAAQLASANLDYQGFNSLTASNQVDQTSNYGTAGANGIGNSLHSCAIFGSICSIFVPYTYPTTENLPCFVMGWYSGSAPSTCATTGTNPILMPNGSDIRYSPWGDTRVVFNHPGSNTGNNKFYAHWNATYADPSWISIADNLGALDIETNYVHGFRNNNSDGTADKTNLTNLTMSLNRWGVGQSILTQGGERCYADGDCVIDTKSVTSWGGMVDGSGEGTHLGDLFATEGNVEDSGTITATSATAGSQTITVNETQGVSTAGQGRFVVFNSGTYTGTLSAVTGSAQGPAIFTVATGSSFPASTVVGTLGTAVILTPTPTGPQLPVTATVTPTFSTGSINQITVGSTVCVMDGGNFSTLHPTAVNTTSGTFTATFIHSQTSTATMALGGGCGFGLDVVADDSSASNLLIRSNIQAIQGTLHRVVPIAYTTSTNAYGWVSQDGTYAVLVSVFPLRSTAFVLYPIARLDSVVTNGTVGPNWQLEPNNAPTTVGVNYFVPISHVFRITTGQVIYEAYHVPTAAGNVYNGPTYNIPLKGNDNMFQITNNGNFNLYKRQGGPLYAPLGFRVAGPHAQTLIADYTPQQFFYNIGCPEPGTACNLKFVVGAHYNGFTSGAGYDVSTYNQANGSFGWDVANQTTHFAMFGDGFEVPGLATSSVTAASIAANYKLYYDTTLGCIAAKDSSNTVHCASGGNASFPATGTTNGTYTLYSTVANSTSSTTYQAGFLNTIAAGSGVSISGTVNQVIGTTKTVRTVTTSPDSVTVADCSNTLYITNSSAQTENLPQIGIGSTPLPIGCYIKIAVKSTAGSVTFTPATSTVNFGNTSMTLTAGSGGELVANGTDYDYYAYGSPAASGPTIAPPYMQIAGVSYIPSDNMATATIPVLTGLGATLGSATVNTTTNTNNDVLLSQSSYTNDSYYGQTTKVTSIEAAFRTYPTGSGNSGTAGIYLCDSTNNHTYSFVLQGSSNQLIVNTYSYTNATTLPTYGATPFSGDYVSMGSTIHLKIAVSGGTATFYEIVNGLTPVSLYTVSVGTIANMGIQLTKSGIDLYSLVQN